MPRRPRLGPAAWITSDEIAATISRDRQEAARAARLLVELLERGGRLQ